MTYILNIAKRNSDTGRHEHYAKVEIPDNVPQKKIIQRAMAIAAGFPEGEGYKCELTNWETTGTPIALNWETFEAGRVVSQAAYDAEQILDLFYEMTLAMSLHADFCTREAYEHHRGSYARMTSAEMSGTCFVWYFITEGESSVLDGRAIAQVLKSVGTYAAYQLQASMNVHIPMMLFKIERVGNVARGSKYLLLLDFKSTINDDLLAELRKRTTHID